MWSNWYAFNLQTNPRGGHQIKGIKKSMKVKYQWIKWSICWMSKWRDDYGIGDAGPVQHPCVYYVAKHVGSLIFHQLYKIQIPFLLYILRYNCVCV